MMKKMVVVLVITTKQSWTPGGINGGWRQLSNNYLTTTTSGSPGRHHLPLLHVHCLPLLSHPAIIRPLLSSKFQRSSPLLLLIVPPDSSSSSPSARLKYNKAIAAVAAAQRFVHQASPLPSWPLGGRHCRSRALFPELGACAELSLPCRRQ